MDTSENNKTYRGGIIFLVAALFLIGGLATGILSYVSFNYLANKSVTTQMEKMSSQVYTDVAKSIMEYPAWEWLLRYWHDHADEMDIEYDVDFSRETRTAEKCRQFAAGYPDLQLNYVTEQELGTIPEEAQKLYAEIIYSWLITRLNEIKRSFGADFLFCVSTDPACKSQFFLLSAADPGAVRGTNYEDVYTLGKVVDQVNESQSRAMMRALEKQEAIADAGEYVDCYYSLGKAGDMPVLIGMTYFLGNLHSDMHDEAVKSTISGLILQAVLSIMCLSLISVFVLRPLRKVQKSIRNYKKNKDSRAVREDLKDIDPSNEIGQLSEDVVGLALEIDSYTERIQTIAAEKERIGTELALGARIQANMLPNSFPAFPDRPEIDIFATMSPAKEVGGDFYDFFFIDADHLGIIIADVSGKGVPAALFMMVSRLMVQNYAMTGLSPAEVFRSVNEQICKSNREEMFVTIWFGILDIATGAVTASNAGHEYPVIIHGGGEIELVRDKHDFVIGGLADVKYREYGLKLLSGDRLFLYTDGIPEATNSSGGFFGMGRLMDALRASTSSTPEGILRDVRSSIDDFVRDAEQFDDMTMLCLEYKGVPAAADAPREEADEGRTAGQTGA